VSYDDGGLRFSPFHLGSPSFVLTRGDRQEIITWRPSELSLQDHSELLKNSFTFITLTKRLTYSFFYIISLIISCKRSLG
jgi:hypothetical protein